MSEVKPMTVKVEALKAHTYNGDSYEVGDTYDFTPVDNPAGISVDAQVQSLQDHGFAVRVDRVAHAKKAAEAAKPAKAEKPAKARKAKAKK